MTETPPPTTPIIQDQATPVSTPCIKVCAVSGASGLCIGCGRTLKEIATWGAMSERERLDLMAQLPARMMEASQASST
jgi:predicted Fe-S protein YdhL (DUF1289 family)